MYCLAFVLASATSFSGHAGWKLLLGTSYIGLQAVMLPPLVLGRSTMLIYVLLDSIPARKIFPDAATWPTVLPIYYGLLAASYVILSMAFSAAIRSDTTTIAGSRQN